MKPHNRKLQLLLFDDPNFSPTAAVTTSPPPSIPLTPQPPSREELYLNPPFDSAIALTVLILLSVLFFLGFFSIYLRRFAADQNDPRPGFSSHRRWTHQTPSGAASSAASTSYSTGRNTKNKGLDPEVVKSLPVYTSYTGEANNQIVECPICLGEFEEKETVKMIPYCQHVFHLPCIDTWLMNHVTCPVCRGTQLFGDKKGDVGVISRGHDGDTCTHVGDVGSLWGVGRTSSCPPARGGMVSVPRSPSL